MLEQLSKNGKALSDVMQHYIEGHFMSGELNYRVRDIQKVIADVKQKFAKDGKEDFTDGYSLESSDWRFNIRPSNTEPLLRLNIEARQAGLVEKIKTDILSDNNSLTKKGSHLQLLSFLLSPSS